MAAPVGKREERLSVLPGQLLGRRLSLGRSDGPVGMAPDAGHALIGALAVRAYLHQLGERGAGDGPAQPGAVALLAAAMVACVEVGAYGRNSVQQVHYWQRHRFELYPGDAQPQGGVGCARQPDPLFARAILPLPEKTLALVEQIA